MSEQFKVGDLVELTETGLNFPYGLPCYPDGRVQRQHRVVRVIPEALCRVELLEVALDCGRATATVPAWKFRKVHEPFTPAWLTQRAMIAAFARE